MIMTFPLLLRCVAIGIITGLAVGMVPAQAQTQANRVAIPIRDVKMSTGVHRYTIPVTVGGVVIETGLDTGSTGLRILPGAVPTTQVQTTADPFNYAYGSGVRYDGIIARSTVSLGPSGDVSFALIQAIGCTPKKPRCPASRIEPEEYRIMGGGISNEGFKAIIGINMGDDKAPNPLIALGVNQWIVELPEPGSATAGKLILNPSAQDMTGYRMFPLYAQFANIHGGIHDAIPGCLSNLKNKKSVCGPTLLDSGAPGIHVLSKDGENPWSEGQSAQIAFTENGQTVLAADFRIGDRDDATRVTTETRPELNMPRVLAGALPYFTFSVLYDAEHQQIGLKPRQ